MTAYNALLHPAQWEDSIISASTLSGTIVDKAAFKAIALYVVTNWSGHVASINLHALAWAMTHFTNFQQQEISTRLQETPMKDTPHSVPPDVMARLTQSLDALNTALLAKDPQMPNHLRESHRVLISYPETVHLLDDGEIATLIQGAVVYTNTEIVKAKASTRKAASKVTVDDL